MTNKHDEIWAQIEEQRANYASIIAKADETIKAAQALKKDAREGLDALPVAKVRRPRKTTEALPGQGELPAQQERDLRQLPGALEMFPNGIERAGGKS